MASSSLKGYTAKNLTDGLFTTAWVEGVEGPGINEYAEFTFKKKVTLHQIGIIAGYNKSKEIYYNNNRVEEIDLYINGEFFKTVSLPDGYAAYNDPSDQNLSYEERSYLLFRDYSCYHIISLSNDNIAVKNVRMVIKKVYKGEKYDDTCISEVLFLEKNNEKECGGR
ncbi:MAG: hypothetical protein JXR90_11555 [Spirochaetes bacterium]|nr:hypothetical protein [Spirochaetota bacterium]